MSRFSHTARRLLLPAVCTLSVISLQGPTFGQESFIRGNANSDSFYNVADPVMVLNYLFAGESSSIKCLEAADANSDGSVNVADASYLFNHLFGSGPPPAAPFPSCGTSDEMRLGCDVPQCSDAPVLLASHTGCMQCETCVAPDLTFISEALSQQGIVVLNARMDQAATCGLCDVCPSADVYVVEVSADDVALLRRQGWFGWSN